MSDGAKKDQAANGEWTMPEPVFRSSDGYTPKTAIHSVQDEIPTEPGFSDDETEEDISLHETVESTTEDDKGGQAVRASTKTRIRHPKKRSGCARTFGLIAGAIALSIFAIVAAVIYFLVFYKPADTSF
ncbi:MAG: hypothetical protein IPO41_09725 [Acidobacteria bacterium]|nr:hypothetical protein [Acidobacteriota bacterium]